MLLVTAALAWDTQGATWPDEAFPVPWYLDTTFLTASAFDEAAGVAAAQAAFDTWAAVSCAGVTFTYAGEVSATFAENDGRNVIFFLEDAWPDEASLLSTPSFATDGTTLLDVDVAINGQGYAWSTTDADGRTRMDLQGNLTHEIGHLLGLWHSREEGATLNPAMAGSPEARTLETDDVTGLCSLYDFVAGTGEQGAACTDEDDCAAGHACVADEGSLYCALDCTDGAACAAGTACVAVTLDQSVCIPKAEEAACGCASSAGGAGGPVAAALVLLGLLRRRAGARLRSADRPRGEAPTERPRWLSVGAR